MQAPSVKPKRPERDVIVVPEMRSPWRPALVAAAAAAVVVALVSGAIAGYAWQRGEVRDREAQVRSALDAVRTADGLAAAAEASVAELQVGMDRLRSDLRLARRSASVVSASRREVRQLLLEAEARLDALRADFVEVAGPPLGDGERIGRIAAVGAGQSPPRLVIDPGQWFTGPAARRAALEDGVIGTGDPWPSHRYFRSGDPGWRVVFVDPTAPVTLRRWQGFAGVTIVDLAKLQQILSSVTRRAKRVAGNPFWITVSGGEVISIREQRYP